MKNTVTGSKKPPVHAHVSRTYVLIVFFSLFLTFAFLGCSGNETIEKVTTNTAPTAKITSPKNGQVFAADNYITFTGVGTDTEDGVISDSSLVWSSDKNGIIGKGSNFTINTNALLTGTNTHVITLTVTDSKGATDSVSISIDVTSEGSSSNTATAPSVTINNPATGTTFDDKDYISFNGTAFDYSGVALKSDSLIWTSSKDGVIGKGATVTTNSLSTGTHIITLTATDDKGLAGSSSITIAVGNMTPTVNISKPLSGEVFNVGDYIVFEGQANDSEDGALSGASLVWTSDDGTELGQGGSITVNSLASGNHVITLTATDKDGGKGADTITITVGNTKPVVTITRPATGTVFSGNDYIVFEGNAVDAEDGAITGDALVWTSSEDGVIGKGTSFTTNTLSTELPHTITLTATDSEGAVGSSSISISIGNTAPTVTINGPTYLGPYQVGEFIVFNGTGSDSEDGPLSGSSLVWYSNKEGIIGEGTSVTINSLSSGTHIITLVATDRDGATASVSITVTVS